MGIFSGLAGLALTLPNLMRQINKWPWMAEMSRRHQAYFALPPASAPCTFNRRDQTILLALAIVFQALYLLIIPLGIECDAAMYFNYAKSILGVEGGAYTYHRPPGYPVFLIVTGQFLFDSFVITVMVQALMGVLAPLLVYRRHKLKYSSLKYRSQSNARTDKNSFIYQLSSTGLMSS
jgi:hypothetical protein